MNWIVYIVEARNGHLYTGVTTNMPRRIRQHLGELVGGAKFFRGNPPKFYWEIGEFANRSEAQAEESRIKKLSRSAKKELIK